MTSPNINEAIHRQREALTALLGGTMQALARECGEFIGNRAAMEALLRCGLSRIASCKHLYVLDTACRQLTDTITREGPDPSHFGRDRATRPYMRDILGIADFKLSEAYISKNRKVPMLTAVQVIRNAHGDHLGFLGADYDLRELPGTDGIECEPKAWLQVKGDPAIRGGLFAQQRVQSEIDTRIDVVLPLMQELITQHGVFHGKVHFSSNRATIWLMDDPYSYRILTIEELIDPNICLAYPHHAYTERATVPPERIPAIFAMFKALRFADDTIYLRAGSLNVVNGLVALNFSCDGSHYVPHEQFLAKGLEFWVGAAGG